MIDNIDFETYISVSKNKLQIFLFDTKNLKNIYKNQIEIQNELNFEDHNNLSNFLDDNIFKIEKLTGKFIKNICLILENTDNLNLEIGIKKKNYDNLINRKNIKNTLIEIKDLFKENYQEQTILHIIIKNYLIDGKNYSILKDNLRGDYCLEINFISIPYNVLFRFDKILKKYQIKISQFIDGNYLKDYFNNEIIELSEMAHKIRHGCNDNEVLLIPKNKKNKGFFEKFFNLFS